MSEVIDITPAVSVGINVWPGDTAYAYNRFMDTLKGDHITLASVTTTLHLGAHADGPNHYSRTSVGVGEMKLEHFLGPCRVIEARVKRGERVRVSDVVGGLPARIEPRVLIKTGTFDGFAAWNSDFSALSVELVDALAARGVMTVGVDTPSVDLQESKEMVAHLAIARHGIAILEGLELSRVESGAYELIALPMKLMGADASPVRAVLRR
jgi:arylformamidase